MIWNRRRWYGWTEQGHEWEQKAMVEMRQLFRCGLDDVRAARRWTRHSCESLGCPEVAASAELVVDELVVNAFVHASTDALVVLETRDGCLVGTVRDFGAGTVIVTARPTSFPHDVNEWGLRVVEALTVVLSVENHDIGKSVVFAIACAPGSERP